MESQDQTTRTESTDGNDQGAIGATRETVCTEQIPGSPVSPSAPRDQAGWSQGVKLSLKPDTDYVILGRCLNDCYLMAVDNFNNETENSDEPGLTYAQAFWNGYGAAIIGVQSMAAARPVDPAMQ
jgi:hypothetical protein